MAGAGAGHLLGHRARRSGPTPTTETDVIEEIARHHGYSRIPKRVPTSVQIGALTPLPARPPHDPPGPRRPRPRTRPCRCPFLAPGDLARAGLPGEAVTLTNPLAAEESVLRTSLRPGLLRAVAYNESHRTDGVALFEIGKVFGVPPPGTTLPDEREHLAVVLAGREAAEAVRIWEVLHHTLGLPGPGIDQVPRGRRSPPGPLGRPHPRPRGRGRGG